MRKLLILLTTGTLLALSSGCSGGRHDPAEKFYLVSVNLKMPYWQSANSGLVRAAKQFGVSAETVGPDNYDAAAEADAFKRAVAKKPSGILVSCADPKLMTPEIDAAIAQGIPVITIDSDCPGSKRLSFVGTNNFQIGQTGGKMLAKQLGGKGSVAIFTIAGQPNLEERRLGYLAAFGDTAIKTQVVDMKGDPRVAFDAASEMIDKNKAPDAFACLEASSCAEIAEVLDRKKVTGKTIIAMDASDDTIKWVKSGLINTTIAQKPFTMSFYAVKMLDDILHYKPANLDSQWAMDSFAPLPAFVDTGTTLLDKSNADQYVKARESANAAK